MEEYDPHFIKLEFHDVLLFVWISIQDENEGNLINVFCPELRKHHQWKKQDRAVGQNKTVRLLKLLTMKVTIYGGDNNDHRGISSEEYKCIEAFYRGAEFNSTINCLKIDMDLFPGGGTPRTLNLHDAQFKDYFLKEVILNGSEQTSNNRNLAIASALEIMSLKGSRFNALRGVQDQLFLHYFSLAMASEDCQQLHMA